MTGLGGLCVCGHDWIEHYTYSLNGHREMRCRACDPHSNRSDMPTNYAMTAGSYEAAMYEAADHDFVPLLQSDAAPTDLEGPNRA